MTVGKDDVYGSNTGEPEVVVTPSAPGEDMDIPIVMVDSVTQVDAPAEIPAEPVVVLPIQQQEVPQQQQQVVPKPPGPAYTPQPPQTQQNSACALVCGSVLLTVALVCCCCCVLPIIIAVIAVMAGGTAVSSALDDENWMDWDYNSTSYYEDDRWN